MQAKELLKKINNDSVYRQSRSTIAFLITEKCPVGCRHCIIESENVFGRYVLDDSWPDWIRSVSESGVIKDISLTGGEPFAVYETLLNMTAIVRNNGMLPHVTTSAYWAKTEHTTEKAIKELSSAGLAGLGVSVDQFHQEKVNIQNVIRAIRISKRYGLRVGVSYRYHGKSLRAEEAVAQLTNIIGDTLKELDTINIGLIQRSGRAARELDFARVGTEEPKSLKLCTAIGPMILPDGTVTCCCGAPLPPTSPLIIGNLNQESFSEIYRRFEEHPLLPFLKVMGLTEMVDLLRTNGLVKEITGYDAPEEFCSLCQQMFSNDKYVKFFTYKFSEPSVRRELGVKMFLLHGDTKLILQEEMK